MASKTTNSRTSNSAQRELGADPNLDQELYIRPYTRPDEIASPDVGLDAIVDFIAEAAQTIPRLIAEIRRLRSL
jgi:hypothetical protein